MVVLVQNNGRHHPISRMHTPTLEHRIACFRIRPIREWGNIIHLGTMHLSDEPGTAAQALELDLGDTVPSPVVQAGMLPKERVREIYIAMLVAWMARHEYLRHRKIHRRRVIQFDPALLTHRSSPR